MPETPTDGPIRARLRRGDEEAWSRIVAEIMPRAIAAIRRKFPDYRTLDAEDVVHSALRSILVLIVKDNNPDDGLTWDDLLGLLIVVAYRKRIDQGRKTKAQESCEAKY